MSKNKSSKVDTPEPEQKDLIGGVPSFRRGGEPSDYVPAVPSPKRYSDDTFEAIHRLTAKIEQAKEDLRQIMKVGRNPAAGMARDALRKLES